MLLTGLLPMLAQPAFWCNPGPPAQGLQHLPWIGPFPMITNQEKILQLDLMETFFSTEAPSSLITLAYFKLIHKTSQYSCHIVYYHNLW